MIDAEKDKCVAAFYRIDDDVIWNKFVVAKVDDVSCANVFEYDFSSAELAEHLGGGGLGGVMRSDMRSELDAGATYVFVKPAASDPVAGFALAKLLGH